jgi:hypothetical protein
MAAPMPEEAPVIQTIFDMKTRVDIGLQNKGIAEINGGAKKS